MYKLRTITYCQPIKLYNIMNNEGKFIGVETVAGLIIMIKTSRIITVTQASEFERSHYKGVKSLIKIDDDDGDVRCTNTINEIADKIFLT